MTKMSDNKNIQEPNPEDFGLKNFTKFLLPSESQLKAIKSDLNFKISKSEVLIPRLKEHKKDAFFWLVGVILGLGAYFLSSIFGGFILLSLTWGLLMLVGLNEKSYLLYGFLISVVVIFLVQVRKIDFKYQSTEDRLNFYLKDVSGNDYTEKITRLRDSLNQAERMISYQKALEQYERQKAETGENWWRALSGYELEEAVSVLFNRKGYQAYVTKKSGDGGIDVVVRSTDKTLLIQCKGWESKVGVKPIREMAGVVVHSNEINPTGVILSTNGFTVEAIKFAKQSGLLLWDSKTLSEIAKGQYEV